MEDCDFSEIEIPSEDYCDFNYENEEVDFDELEVDCNGETVELW